MYLIDTESDPPMEPVLSDLIASGLVEYSYVTRDSPELGMNASLAPGGGREGGSGGGSGLDWQGPVYSLCLRRYGARHRWMGAWVGGQVGQAGRLWLEACAAV